MQPVAWPWWREVGRLQLAQLIFKYYGSKKVTPSCSHNVIGHGDAGTLFNPSITCWLSYSQFSCFWAICFYIGPCDCSSSCNNRSHLDFWAMPQAVKGPVQNSQANHTGLCSCLALASFRFDRGQDEEQDEHQPGWCRSGSKTAHRYLGRAEWGGMFLGCKHTTGIGHHNSIPQEREEQCLPLLNWQGGTHDTI